MQLNPSRPFFGLFALFIFVYAIYVLLAGGPLTRINRICTPVVLWPERAAVAIAGVFSPAHTPGIQNSFNHGFTDCRRMTFSVLYRPEYERLKAKVAQEQANKPAPTKQTPAVTESTAPADPSRATKGTRP